MSTQALDRTFYMACLDLTNRRCLVVGAGPVALEKIEGLLACGARVEVVAKSAIAPIRELAGSSSIRLTIKPYEADDLKGAFLVVAATSDPATQQKVYQDAEARSMLVNVVDVPRLCNFILPAIVRQGPIAIAISTSGASPALAKRMKREIAQLLGPEHARLAELLNNVRDWARAELPTYAHRREFFESIVNGTPDPIEMLQRNDEESVRDLIEAAQARAKEVHLPV